MYTHNVLDLIRNASSDESRIMHWHAMDDSIANSRTYDASPPNGIDGDEISEFLSRRIPVWS
jgi:hypothetical protein